MIDLGPVHINGLVAVSRHPEQRLVIVRSDPTRLRLFILIIWSLQHKARYSVNHAPVERFEHLSAPFVTNSRRIASFYRTQALIYDQTRWAFLFGRREIIDTVAQEETPATILEIGCGTGVNIRRLHRTFPDSAITGVDLSAAMLRVARSRTKTGEHRVDFVEMVYDRPIASGRPFDLVLFSYSLSLMNPGWEGALSAVCEDLRPGGRIAVVDFHDCPGRIMKWYMHKFLVRIDGHLLPELNRRFDTTEQDVRRAYGGRWRYFTYIGKNR